MGRLFPVCKIRDFICEWIFRISLIIFSRRDTSASCVSSWFSVLPRAVLVVLGRCLTYVTSASDEVSFDSMSSPGRDMGAFYIFFFTSLDCRRCAMLLSAVSFPVRGLCGGSE